MTNLKKIALTSLVAIFAIGATAHADPVLTSQEYVDSGLGQKQNKIAGTVGQIVTATGTLGQITYTGVDAVAVPGSTNLVTSGAVASAIAGIDTVIDGLGSAAFAETTDFDTAGSAAAVQTNLNTFQNRGSGFATAIQGTLADTALQAGDNVSELINDAGYLTSADMSGYAVAANLGSAAFAETTDFDAAGSASTVQTNLNTFQNRAAGFATSAQGALADTALQAADLSGYATETYADTVAGAVQTNLNTFQNRAAGFATSAQGALADSALQAADIENKMDKVDCNAGQMLFHNGTAFVCVNVAVGQYTGS
ncbi:MAG: hypothetical protein FWE52_01340 [Alphaproteobacteria bacterium]|nr:hypothetical protein [Alphaproteobacteria bacterium]